MPTSRCLWPLHLPSVAMQVGRSGTPEPGTDRDNGLRTYVTNVQVASGVMLSRWDEGVSIRKTVPPHLSEY